MAGTATARVQPMTAILSTCALSTSAAHLYSCRRTTAALQVVAHVLYSGTLTMFLPHPSERCPPTLYIVKKRLWPAH